MKVEYEHPAQHAGAAVLRAVALDDPGGLWDRLSRETRGLLEGIHAVRTGTAIQEVAAVAGRGEVDGLRAIVRPLREALLAELGGAERVNALGVPSARVVDRRTAYVLLLPEFGDERIVSETDWRPSHLLAFVNESREWVLDLARTAELSAEAQLPDPLGGLRP